MVTYSKFYFQEEAPLRSFCDTPSSSDCNSDSSNCVPESFSSSSSSSTPIEEGYPCPCNCDCNEEPAPDDCNKNGGGNSAGNFPIGSNPDNPDDREGELGVGGEGNNSGGDRNAFAAFSFRAVPESTIGVRYKPPLEWTAVWNASERDVTVMPPPGSAISFHADTGSAEAVPVGASRKLNYRVRLVSEDGQPCLSGSPAFLDMVQSNGRIPRILDSIGRPERGTNRRQNEAIRDDSFRYNTRNELVHAALGETLFQYEYDNIGNREQALEELTQTDYVSNSLNQYTSIEPSDETSFIPAYDADGNQTRIRTTTGIWNVAYDANNRPVQLTSEDGKTVIECRYDYMGRRLTKKVTVQGAVILHEGYHYLDYLQIAAVNLLADHEILHITL